MKLVKDFTDRHYKLTGFFAGILLIFIDLIVNNIRTSYYDAQGYEIMADHLIKENFFLFDFNVRGGGGVEA